MATDEYVADLYRQLAVMRMSRDEAEARLGAVRDLCDLSPLYLATAEVRAVLAAVDSPADHIALFDGPPAEVDDCGHHSWDGLMELLDEHWPDDIFPTYADNDRRDPGPRIVSLLRWVDALSVGRAAVDGPAEDPADTFPPHQFAPPPDTTATYCAATMLDYRDGRAVGGVACGGSEDDPIHLSAGRAAGGSTHPYEQEPDENGVPRYWCRICGLQETAPVHGGFPADISGMGSTQDGDGS